jgi:hypothetical protein
MVQKSLEGSEKSQKITRSINGEMFVYLASMKIFVSGDQNIGLSEDSRSQDRFIGSIPNRRYGKSICFGV